MASQARRWAAIPGAATVRSGRTADRGVGPRRALRAWVGPKPARQPGAFFLAGVLLHVRLVGCMHPDSLVRAHGSDHSYRHAVDQSDCSRRGCTLLQLSLHGECRWRGGRDRDPATPDRTPWLSWHAEGRRSLQLLDCHRRDRCFSKIAKGSICRAVSEHRRTRRHGERRQHTPRTPLPDWTDEYGNGSRLGSPIHALPGNSRLRLRIDSWGLSGRHVPRITILPALEQPSRPGESVGVDTARTVCIVPLADRKSGHCARQRAAAGVGGHAFYRHARVPYAYVGRPLVAWQSSQSGQRLRGKYSGLHCWTTVCRIRALALDQRALGTGAAVGSMADSWSPPDVPGWNEV